MKTLGLSWPFFLACVCGLVACRPSTSIKKQNADLKKELKKVSKSVSRAESEAALYDIAQIFTGRRLRAELSSGSIREAEWLLERGRPNDALAKLMRSHELDREDPHPIIRALNLLTYRNFARQLLQAELGNRPYTVRFSPDGQRVVVGGEKGLAQLFNVATREAIAVPFEHDGTVNGLAFSPDGALLASGAGDGVVRLWDAASGDPRGSLKIGRAVALLEFSRNGRRLLVATDSHTVSVWDIVTGRPLFEPLEFPGLHRVRLNPDGKSFAIAVDDEVSFRNADTGESSHYGLLAPNAVDFLAFSEDGAKLLVASGLAVSLYDSLNARKICGPIRHETTLTACCLDPRGTRIFTAAEDFTVRMWSAATGDPVGEPMHHERIVRDIRLSKDGALLVTASYDGSARVWEAETGEPYTEPMRHLSEVESADISPDGTLAVTASQSGNLRLWDVRDGRLRSLPIAAIGGLDAVLSLPDREVVASTPDDGDTLRLWDATRQAKIGADIVPGSPLMQVKSSPDGRLVITRSQDNNLRLWDSTSGQQVGQPIRLGNPPSELEISADSKRLLAVVGESIVTADLTAAAPVGVALIHSGNVTDAKWNEAGDRLVTGSQDGFVHVWNFATGADVFPPIQHTERISRVHFSQDGSQVLVGCYDGTARLYDAATGAPVGHPMRHYGPVLDANFSADGLQILTGGTDGTARIWGADTTEAVGQPFVHDESVWRVNLDASGRWLQAYVGELPTVVVPHLWDVEARAPAKLPPGLLLTLGFDARQTHLLAGFAEGKTLLIDARSGDVIGTPLRHKGALSTALFSADGRRILTTSWDDTARLWNTDTGAPLSDPIEHEQPVTEGMLSPGGQRIITVEGERNIHVWELGPIDEPAPEWFPRLVAAVSGRTVGSDGVVAPVKFDRTDALDDIRQELAAAPADDAWATWGRWFLADRSKRTISPQASLTIPQYIETLIARNTLESLNEASRLAAGNSGLQKTIRLRRASLVAYHGDPRQ